MKNLIATPTLVILLILQSLILSSQTILTDFDNAFSSTYGYDFEIFQDTLFSLNQGTLYSPGQFYITQSDGFTTEVISSVAYDLQNISLFKVTPNHIIIGDQNRLSVVDKNGDGSSFFEYQFASVTIEGDSLFITHRDDDFNWTLVIRESETLELIAEHPLSQFIGIAEDFHFFNQSIYTSRSGNVFQLGLDDFNLDTLFVYISEYEFNYDTSSDLFFDDSFISIENDYIVSTNLITQVRDTISETSSIYLYSFDQYLGHYLADDYHIIDLETRDNISLISPETIYKYSNGYFVYQTENEFPSILSLKDWGSEPKLSSVTSPYKFVASDDNRILSVKFTGDIGVFDFDTGEGTILASEIINIGFVPLAFGNDLFVIGSTLDDGRELHKVTDDELSLVDGLPNLSLGGSIETFIFDDAVFLSPEVYYSEPDGIYLLEQNGYSTIGTEYTDVFKGDNGYYLPTNNSYSAVPINKDIYKYNLVTGSIDSITTVSLFADEKISKIYEHSGNMALFFEESITIYDGLTDTLMVLDSTVTGSFFAVDKLFYTDDQTWWIYDLSDLTRLSLINTNEPFSNNLNSVTRYQDYILISYTNTNNKGSVLSYNLQTNTSQVIFVGNTNQMPSTQVSRSGDFVTLRSFGDLYFSDGTEEGTYYYSEIEGIIPFVDTDYLIKQSYLPNLERETKLIDHSTKEEYFISDEHFSSYTRINNLLYLTSYTGLDIYDLNTKEIVQSYEQQTSTHLRFRDLLFFSINDTDIGQELYYIDTLTYEMVNVYDLLPGKPSSQVQDFFVYDDGLYFQAYHDGLGKQLWKMENKDVFTTINDGSTQPPITLFPNPALNVITLNVGDLSPSTVEINALDGRTMMQSEYISSLDVSNLLSGIYFISLFDDNGNLITTKRIVKMD